MNTNNQIESKIRQIEELEESQRTRKPSMIIDEETQIIDEQA